MGAEGRPHRLVFFVDGVEVPSPVEELISWAEADPRIDLCAVVVVSLGEENAAKRRGLGAAISSAALRLIERVEWHLVTRPGRERDLLSTRSIGTKELELLTFRPEASSDDGAHVFSTADVERMRALGADLLICFGSPVGGELISASGHGLLSIEYRDIRNSTREPAGFWEVLEREATTGFTVRRFSGAGDPGEIVARAKFTTEIFYLRNKATLLGRSAAHLKQIILDVLDGHSQALPPPFDDRPPRQRPKLKDIFQYSARTAALVADKVMSRLLRKRWHWGVGYGFGDWRQMSLSDSNLLQSPDGHFLADPFACKQDGRYFIFVEDSDFRKGVISVYAVDRQGARAERLGVALDEPFHLSFPFLFRDGQDIFMVPESLENRDIRLYRCTGFPLEWELASVLVADVAAVDSMIVRRNGRWWMLTTMNSSGVGATDAEFCLYSADHPLGPWVASRSNPLFIDSTRARNGGLLSDGESLYRVAQRPDFAAYGKSMAIYRIDEISKDAYSETLIREIEPRFLKGIRGTHHLHSDGELVVFDFLRKSRRTTRVRERAA